MKIKILNKLGIQRLVLSNKKIIYYTIHSEGTVKKYVFFDTEGDRILSLNLNTRLCSVHTLSSLYTYKPYNFTKKHKIVYDTSILIIKEFIILNKTVNYSSWQGSNDSKDILLKAGFEINGVFDSCHGQSNLSLLVKRHEQLNGDSAIRNSINHLEKLLANGETLKNEK